MSSIRLFILSSFDEFGPMHGHLMRTIAERMKVPLWTDISVGAVYGAMKRLAAEGLLRLAERLERVRAMLAESKEVNEAAREHVGLAKQRALRHTEYRLKAEVAYLTDLLNAAADVVADERNPRHRKPKLR